MSVTIKDIAKKAGVSYSTVSKALRNSPLVKKPTKIKIKEIAEQLGYQPNAAARSLVQKKSYTVGVIWPTVERVAPSILITKLNELLEEHSYTTLLSINKVDQAIATFNRFQVDAIIVFGELDNVQELSLASTVPILHYGVQTLKDALTIDVNRQYAIKLGVTHLKELGHEHIAFIGDQSKENTLQRAKLVGFLEGMGLNEKSEIEKLVIPTNGLELHDGYMAAKQLFERQSNISAVISGSYDLTRGILRAANEFEYNVPKHFSIVSYDNIPQSEDLHIELTTVGVPISRIASEITKCVLTMIESKEPTRSVVLEPEININESTRKI
ncbi:LacI family DNA-binding transcriptional regulator [Halalkalibacter sp. AB-rgal2]|uniref:LacI family DNA-binding transcriptional regulator n=1 Tax=Halalkalibacter sp. AB-rgal2 TaxID=3242695 RepID=UPI00359D1A22